MINRRAARNIVAGLLTGFGVGAFLFFIITDIAWMQTAPALAQPGLDLTYRHNEHGDVRYFSAFQTATCTVLPVLSPLLFFLGWRLGAKKNVRLQMRKLGWSMQFDIEDPERVTVWSQLAGCILAPAILYGLGRPLLAALMS